MRGTNWSVRRPPRLHFHARHEFNRPRSSIQPPQADGDDLVGRIESKYI